MNQKFNEALPILEKLIVTGFEAYFVGGSVRDHLLGKEIHDVDIATSAIPEEVMRIFKKNVPVGIEHGTVIVIEQGVNYEITTFRTESDYVDFRRPSEVNFVRSLEDDLKRRDFTMNALAMNSHGEIIDIYHGKQDISNKIIRTVGNPDERFFEDALRMMRGLRFISQLGFTLDERTKQSIIRNSNLLKKISVERITSEFEKLLMGEYLIQCIPKLVESNLVEFLPDMDRFTNNFTHCINFEFQKLNELNERWALIILVLNIDDSLHFLKCWKLPRKRMLQIKNIVDGVINIKKWNKYDVYQYGLKNSISIDLVSSIYYKKMDNSAVIKQLFNELPLHQSSDICVNGRDLMEWCNRKSGKWISVYLERIEREIIEGSLQNTREKIKEATSHWEN